MVNQSNKNFQILLLVHNSSKEVFENLKSENPDIEDSLKFPIKYVQITEGGRSHPLNVGLDLCQNEFVTFLDDDDIVLENWVDNFLSHSIKFPEKIIRSFAYSKEAFDFEKTDINTIKLDELEKKFSYPWDLSEHLVFNRTPIMTIALPIKLINQKKLNFDETLTTNEDWDFLISAKRFAEVQDTNKFTAIYLQWDHGTKNTISEAEWETNRKKILSKFSEYQFTLNESEISKYYKLILELNQEIDQIRWDYKDLQIERNHLHDLIVFYKNSLSFKITSPVRKIGALIKGRSN